MDMNKILDIAYEKDASDIHLICNNKPILRIARTLVPIEEMDVLTPDDMNEMYDYLVMGNVEKDEVFNTTRKLDTSYEYKGVRLRVNISLSDDVPLCTLRIIKNEKILKIIFLIITNPALLENLVLELVLGLVLELVLVELDLVLVGLELAADLFPYLLIF